MFILRNTWIWRTTCAVMVLALPVAAWCWLTGKQESVPAHASQGQTARVAAAAMTLLISEDGFTVDARSGHSVGPADAWAVSLAGAEERYRSLPSVEVLEKYLLRNADRFAAAPNVYFGGWHDSMAGEWVLDITCVVPEKAHAEIIGRLNDQRCIFHLQTKEEYWLPPSTVFTSVVTDQ